MELGPGSQARHVHEVAVDPDVYEWYEYQDWDDWEEDEEQLPVSAAMKGGDRCRQCGKAGHFAKNCSTDMSKVRCFKCGDSGHIGGARVSHMSTHTHCSHASPFLAAALAAAASLFVHSLF